SNAPAETMQRGQEFFNALLVYAKLVKSGSAPGVKPTPMPAEPVMGPALGHIDHQTAIVWIRASQPGEYRLRVWKKGQSAKSRIVTEKAMHEHDLCVKWRLDKLEPDTIYQYEIKTPAGSAITS